MAARAAILGYVGKWAIHPSQIELANRIYSPTAEEIVKAREMIEAYERAESAGQGAASVGGVMIDAATARIFQVVVDRADLI